MSNEKSTSGLPVDSQMPGSTGKGLSLPITALPAHYASRADEILLRLNKLVKTTAGLSSLLSIAAYSLYIASHLHANSPTRAQILSKISQLLGRPAPKVAATALASATPGAAPFAPAIAIINDTRFAMRLVGLLPLYGLLRTLLRTKQPKDALLHRFAVVQASAYIAFQALENLWLLSSKSVVPARYMDKAGGALKVMTWSCRAWLLALLMDVARLLREAAIAKETGAANNMTTDEQAQMEKKWYAELFTVSAWLPMAFHYSLPGGIGMNQGTVGLSGLLGGIGGFSKAWAATKE